MRRAYLELILIIIYSYGPLPSCGYSSHIRYHRLSGYVGTGLIRYICRRQGTAMTFPNYENLGRHLKLRQWQACLSWNPWLIWPAA